MAFLGIDIGTSETRALLIDESGRVIGSATAGHQPFDSPQPGWAEQDPRDWWTACCNAIKQVLLLLNSHDGVTCIGLSGQMHGAVLLDQYGDVIRPAIIGCDQRSGEQCRALNDRFGADRLIALTCNAAVPALTLPKLLWVREHEPESWSRVRYVLLPKDYVRFRLTGEVVTDVADASGALMFDVISRRWSEPMLAAAGLDQRALPQVFESSRIAGEVSRDGAAETGLREGTPVVAGASDQAANALALGIVRPGAVGVTIGETGVVFAPTNRPLLDSRSRVHTFCHAAPGRWHVMGITQAAGLSLRWFRDQFGVSSGDSGDAYEHLCREAAGVSPGADGLLWAPYLMGERTPHFDSNARAALVGLTAGHTRAHVIRAILEGVAFSLREGLEILTRMNIPIDTIRIGGGGTRSHLWRQILADVLGRVVETVAIEGGAAYGAALLAGTGCGIWPSVEAACDAAVRAEQRIEPDPATAALLERQFSAYRMLYPSLRRVLDELP